MQNPLLELKEYEDMDQALSKGQGPVQATGTLDSQKVHLMYELGGSYPWKLVVTYDELRAKDIYDDYRNFTKQVWLYPAKDLLFYAADIHGNMMARQRIQVQKALMEEKGGVVITTLDGLMDHLLPPDHLAAHIIWVENGQKLDLEKLKKELVALGYERTVQVDGMGQFSIRGGILDIFPLTEEFPVRIELWDDEVDSIRSFDLESQRSLEQLEEIRIYPAQEVVLSHSQLEDGICRLRKEAKASEAVFRKNGKLEEGHRIVTVINEFTESLEEDWKIGNLDGYIDYFCDNTVSFIQYFPQNTTLIFLDEPARLQEKGQAVETEFRESMSHRLEKGYLLGGQTGLLYSVKEVLAKLQTGRTVYLTGLDQRLAGMAVREKFAFTVKNVNSYQNSFDLLIKDLTRWKREGYRVVFLTASRTRASRLASDLREYELRAYCPDGFASYGNQEAENPQEERKNADHGIEGEVQVPMVKPGEILVTYGNLHKGFEYPMLKFVIITEGDIFGVERKKRKKKKSSYEAKKIASFSELAVGDYVVHEDHGLGVYCGIEKIERDGIIKDYMKVEYGDGGNLYIPATRLDRIQKYAGSEAKKPKLNKLGGTEWKKTKTKVKGAVQQIARELVELYAARQSDTGFQYGPDTVWQREFEELFPYEETDDQLEAIEATKSDMESRKIMDRLVCGDVGYGKTEIALRAAFKAVQESKQVVYLVPTTILAQQHYNTFIQRMKDFPVRVDMLSRFRTPAQQKKTIEDLKKGLVDVVIGTHRVLSKDIQFKDLGLLVIDEEQRFGVTHKEKIKKLKESVDVLTLTATPIPRTLHMSLVGIRDMSVLEEPPVDRIPIQTYVMEYNEEMIREAIHRELARNGQVYYVYNRVHDIDDLAGRIQALVPEANVVFAHGQMSERQLERIMADFINGEIDVLVSTTIIETGLDIPNANTMIIHDADRMGLSQLYQLRGRVGRSSRTSYAFLMYKRDKILREEAEKRLQAIREFTELGSGIKIAMRDLEIRGAGNVLGAEQHGHMDAVGYDLYCKLLKQAVLALKGKNALEEAMDFETVVECDIDAYIPPHYIKNEYLKLDIYKRISAIESEEEEMDMQDELIDRFGDLPKAVLNLLTIASIKAMAHQVYITEVLINRQEYRLSIYPKAKLNPEGLTKLVQEGNGRIKLSGSEAPVLTYLHREKNRDCHPVIQKVKEALRFLQPFAD
ncbi:MAG: transcription-repair coupling factor [Lachnospiraceae bacterium]|jgi:transcription-repair coupling factor (superfamily II helicase)|nr:transcription-repair coupling factor [Lachnospiraceae bacterium]